MYGDLYMIILHIYLSYALHPYLFCDRSALNSKIILRKDTVWMIKGLRSAFKTSRKILI